MGLKAEYIKCGQYDISQKQDSFKTDTFIQFASFNQELYKKIENNYVLVSKNGKYYF